MNAAILKALLWERARESRELAWLLLVPLLTLLPSVSPFIGFLRPGDIRIFAGALLLGWGVALTAYTRELGESSSWLPPHIGFVPVSMRFYAFARLVFTFSIYIPCAVALRFYMRYMDIVPNQTGQGFDLLPYLLNACAALIIFQLLFWLTTVLRIVRRMLVAVVGGGVLILFAGDLIFAGPIVHPLVMLAVDLLALAAVWRISAWRLDAMRHSQTHSQRPEDAIAVLPAPARTRAFESLANAQAWYEWRLTRLYVPVYRLLFPILAAIILCAFVYPSGSSWTPQWMDKVIHELFAERAFMILVATASLMCAIMAAISSSLMTLSPSGGFIFNLPLSTGQLAAAHLRNNARIAAILTVTAWILIVAADYAASGMAADSAPIPLSVLCLCSAAGIWLVLNSMVVYPPVFGCLLFFFVAPLFANSASKDFIADASISAIPYVTLTLLLISTWWTLRRNILQLRHVALIVVLWGALTCLAYLLPHYAYVPAKLSEFSTYLAYFVPHYAYVPAKLPEYTAYLGLTIPLLCILPLVAVPACVDLVRHQGRVSRWFYGTGGAA